jgi:hypothetical protein
MEYPYLVIFAPMVNIVKVWHLLGLRLPFLGWHFLPSTFLFICRFLAGLLYLTRLLGFIPIALAIDLFGIVFQLQVRATIFSCSVDREFYFPDSFRI